MSCFRSILGSWSIVSCPKWTVAEASKHSIRYFSNSTAEIAEASVFIGLFISYDQRDFQHKQFASYEKKNYAYYWHVAAESRSNWFSDLNFDNFLQSRTSFHWIFIKKQTNCSILFHQFLNCLHIDLTYWLNKKKVGLILVKWWSTIYMSNVKNGSSFFGVLKFNIYIFHSNREQICHMSRTHSS